MGLVFEILEVWVIWSSPPSGFPRTGPLVFFFLNLIYNLIYKIE